MILGSRTWEVYPKNMPWEHDHEPMYYLSVFGVSLSFDLGEFRWHVQPSVALEDPQTSQRVATSQKMEWFEIPKELPSSKFNIDPAIYR